MNNYRILSYKGISFKISSFEEVQFELMELELNGLTKPVVIQEFTKTVLTKETAYTHNGESWEC